MSGGAPTTWRDVAPDAYRSGLTLVARRRGSGGVWLARRWSAAAAHLDTLEWHVV